MQDLFGGGVRRLVAKEAVALGIQSRVGKAQAQAKPIKFKCLPCAEQMYADTLLCVPGDGTNELRVGLDWPGSVVVWNRVLAIVCPTPQIDEVVEVSVDFVKLSRHGEINK